MSATLTTTPRMSNRTTRAATSLIRFMVAVSGIFLAIVVAIFVGLGIIQAVVGGLGDDGAWVSVWENSVQPMRYFPLAIGVGAVPVLLPAYVANGITRREFAVGESLMIVGTSLAFGVVAAVGFGVEHVLFDWAGHSPEPVSRHLFAGAGDVVPIVGEYALLISVHMATGWLIGIFYYRFGGWIGTALLPIAVIPALAVEALLSVSWAHAVMIEGIGVERGPLPLMVPACLGVIAATFWINYLLIRRLAIAP